MLTRAFLFLLDSLADLLTIVLLLRFFMQLMRVSFANPLGTFVVQASNWLVMPLRRAVPPFFGVDMASLLPALLLQVLVPLAVFGLRGGFELMTAGKVLGMVGMLLWQGVLGSLRLSIYMLIAALVLQALLSWVNPHSPLGRPVAQLTQPVLKPLRQMIPPVADIDLSPLFAILLAQLVLIFL